MTLSRRDFSRLAAAASASLLLPPAFGQANSTVAGPSIADPYAPTPKGAKKTRYCIVGLGRISLDHFMPGTRQSELSEVTALVSGHPEKAHKFAAEYNVPASSIYTYENFDDIRNNPNIDAVYIALPNSMHAEYTIRAARAGKHVLCEKPMSTSVADAKAMIDACAKANRKLMIAYRCQLEPVNLRAIELVRSGALGQIQAIESANGFNIAPGEWRLTRKFAGGGPLMDVGIYSLNASRYLTGEEPIAFSAYSSVIDHDGRFNEVEENLSWTMKFPSGIVASCNTSYGSSMDGYYKVHGSKGWLQLSPAFIYQGIHLTGHVNGVSKGDPGQQFDEPEAQSDPWQFARQADYFATCIDQNLTPKPAGEEGLRDMQYMAEIYKSAGLPFLAS
jgi:predicted dehydrogenase